MTLRPSRRPLVGRYGFVTILLLIRYAMSLARYAKCDAEHTAGDASDSVPKMHEESAGVFTVLFHPVIASLDVLAVEET